MTMVPVVRSIIEYYSLKPQMPGCVRRVSPTPPHWYGVNETVRAIVDVVVVVIVVVFVVVDLAVSPPPMNQVALY
jgi:hypothetical protein